MRKVTLLALMITFTMYTKLGADKYTKQLTPLGFSEKNLITLIKQIGIKHPDIVLAQAKIETGHFTSKIFKSNNNAFGMKLARNRVTTAIGEQYSHAMYISWVQSVKDYKLWQDRIQTRITTQKEYLKYLDKYYATNKKYVDLIKQMI